MKLSGNVRNSHCFLYRIGNISRLTWYVVNWPNGELTDDEERAKDDRIGTLG